VIFQASHAAHAMMQCTNSTKCRFCISNCQSMSKVSLVIM